MSFLVAIMAGNRAFTVNEGETVLQAARRQEVHLSHDCGSGSCGACRARLISGQVHYPGGPPLALTALDMRQGEVLLCRAAPLSDLVLDVQEISAEADLAVRT
ncbi:MAG: 2Fe-2S iron-sulfur cluster-binding protein, partial [Gammaproteobacteria bacterium]